MPQGLPPATTSHDSDIWSRMDYLRVSLEQVKSNFRRFGLLDSQVGRVAWWGWRR